MTNNLPADLKDDWINNDIVMPPHVNGWSSAINQIKDAIPTYSANGNFYTATYTDNTYLLSPVTINNKTNVPPSSYIEGMTVVFKCPTTNSSGCSVNVNSLGNKIVKNIDDSTLDAGVFTADSYIELKYDSTQGYFKYSNSYANQELTNLTSDAQKKLLPSQAGNGGKFLTTDGTDASWQEVKSLNKYVSGGILEAPNGVLTQIGTNTIRIPEGLKVYCSDSRNYDKTLNGFEFTVPSNIDATLPNTMNTPHEVFLTITSDKQTGLLHYRELKTQFFEQQEVPLNYQDNVTWFNPSSNIWMNKEPLEEWENYYAVKLGVMYVSSGVITSLKTFQPIRFVTYNDRITNLQQEDLSEKVIIPYNTVFDAPDDGKIFITSDIITTSSNSLSLGEIRSLKGDSVSVQIVQTGETIYRTLREEYTNPNTYNFTVPSSGWYNLIIVGGGGYGASSWWSYGNNAYGLTAGGGSGAGFVGDIYLSAGNYSVVLGAPAGNTVFYDSNSTALITAGAGGNGVANAAGQRYAGAGGTMTIPGTTQLQNITLNTSGNSGGTDAMVFPTMPHVPGGASVYGGFGAGGASNGSPTSGYFKLEGTYTETSISNQIVETGSLCYRHHLSSNDGSLSIRSCKSGTIDIYKGQQFIIYTYSNDNVNTMLADAYFCPSLLNKRINI